MKKFMDTGQKKVLFSLSLIILSFVLLFSNISIVDSLEAEKVDREEGGYVGTRYEGHDEVVYNFLKHFTYDQYYYSVSSQFTYNNNKGVDNMDFAFFAGLGNQWMIVMSDGARVDLTKAGSTPDLGCNVIRSFF